MNGTTPNLIVAALGPLVELLGIVGIVGVFALLRGQAERRPYFRAWETAFALFAASLTAGLFYERFVNPDSVFYPASPVTTRLTAMAFLVLRLVSMAMVVSGAQLFLRGSVAKWMPRMAVPVAIVLTFAVDTTQLPLAPMRILHGPIGAIAYIYAALLVGRLPHSRRSLGTRVATTAFVLLAVLAASLAGFHALQRINPALTTSPWLVRFARYSFYWDLALRLLLAWAMLRLLVEDNRREADDTRAHLKLVQDRDKLGDLYDPQARLLGRRAFDALVGLDFARAGFGSVARLRIANVQRIVAEQGSAVGDALVAHVAGVVDSAVRSHDRVYRWAPDELLVVMPRAIPSVARARIEMLASRIAPLPVSGVGAPIRAETAVTVRFFSGGEELTAAAAVASQN